MKNSLRRLERLEGRVKAAYEARYDAWLDQVEKHLDEADKPLFFAYTKGDRSPDAVAAFKRWKSRIDQDPEARKVFSKVILAWNCDRLLDPWRGPKA